MEIQNNFAEQTAESETETPQIMQKEEAGSEEEEIDQLLKVPIKGAVKWEKRSSEKNQKT